MDAPSFPERSLSIRRAAARLCLRLAWAPLHEVTLPNGRRADILALREDGGFACIEVKSGLRDFQTDQKWWEYREFSDHLYFAVDIDFPLEILPTETGLIVVADQTADLIREAPEHRLPAARRDLHCCAGGRCWPAAGWRSLRTQTGSPTYVPRCESNNAPSPEVIQIALRSRSAHAGRTGHAIRRGDVLHRIRDGRRQFRPRVGGPRLRPRSGRRSIPTSPCPARLPSRKAANCRANTPNVWTRSSP